MDILPAIVLSAATYFWCQILFPNCRFRVRPLISPLNWFLCLFFMQMVLVPAVVALLGPSIAFLPFMPSNTAISLALILNTLAYGSFCVAVQVLRKRQPVIFIESSRVSKRGWFPPVWLIVIYLILGITGIALRFGSLSSLIDYFTDPQSYLISVFEESGGSTTLAGAAATFLIVFFPFSMIMLWCRGAYQQTHKKGMLSQMRPPILIASAALSASLYSYSRAAFVIPMIAVAAVMTKRNVSFNGVKLIGLGTLVASLVLLVSVYRMTLTKEGGVIAQSLDSSDISDLIQDYGTAPQFLAFFLQNTHYAENPRLGRVSLSSALSPVPILGKSFREQAGASIYASQLGRDDQPIISVGELFLDFSVFGVIAGSLTVGALVAILQNYFDRSSEPFEVYVLQFASVCFSYFIVSGFEVVSQHAIYMSWPIYCFLAYRSMKKRFLPRASLPRQWEYSGS